MRRSEAKCPTALVFNCDFNGLALIQALGRRGVKVFALDSHRSIGTYSRYGEFIRVPNPLTDERGFIDSLLKFRVESAGKPVLFPTNDHWASAIARHRGELEACFELCVAPWEVTSLLLDKDLFARWAQKEALLVPEVWGADEALARKHELPYPVAVKARLRRRAGDYSAGKLWAEAADRLRFRPCDDVRQLESTLKEAENNSVPVLCQRVVRGRSDAMRTIGVYAHEGKVHGILYGRKARGFPPRYGDCVVGIAEPVPDWARELAESICERLRYTGLAEFEIMVDVVSNERFLIEINPRSWSWIGVSAAAGVDLGWLAYRSLVDRHAPDNLVRSCSDGQPVYYAKILADFQNTLLWYRLAGAKDWAASPMRWWKGFRGKNGVFAEFARDDPIVGVVSVALAGKQFLQNLRSVIGGGGL